MWLQPIDYLLDRITMYRLLLYYLIGLLLAAVVLGAFGRLPYSPLAITYSAGLLVAACWLINKALAAFMHAPINAESSLITALILALIISPSATVSGAIFLLFVSLLAMSSKYILAINRKHLFNPAALAVTLTALGPRHAASWWVGTALMLPFVIIGGLLLIRKLRRIPMVAAFYAAALVSTAVCTLLTHGSLQVGVKEVILSSALFFMGYVMLTEPMTSPTTFRRQIWYALLVGALFPPQLHLLGLYSTPERILIVGNIFAYLVTPKVKLFPVLKQKAAIAASSLEFVFSPGQAVAYKPGQYMEWTLPHAKTDARGNRRYFTLASSPTEPDIRLGVKFYNPGSSYKQALQAITAATPLAAAQVAGDFVLPDDQSRKLAFIAGGIGVTPYRSMVKYMLDKREQRSVAMLYAARTAQDVAYQDVFETARQQFGLAVHYVLSEPGRATLDNRYKAGKVDAAMIKAAIPDYAERLFYISGPPPMVDGVRHSLAELGIVGRQIKVDFFPGYA